MFPVVCSPLNPPNNSRTLPRPATNNVYFTCTVIFFDITDYAEYALMTNSPTEDLHLTKFEVAERQLTQAIRLFFLKQDPVSIHTLAEAASQVLYDIGGEHGVKSIMRDNASIRPEKLKEWLVALHKSRNFFKHADRDKLATHEFKEIFNDMSLLDAVNMYVTIKKRWSPESAMFFVWFGLNYPQLLAEGSPHIEILNNIREGPMPNDKSYFFELIEELRSGGTVMPHVVTYLGLNANED